MDRMAASVQATRHWLRGAVMRHDGAQPQLLFSAPITSHAVHSPARACRAFQVTAGGGLRGPGVWTGVNENNPSNPLSSLFAALAHSPQFCSSSHTRQR